MRRTVAIGVLAALVGAACGGGGDAAATSTSTTTEAQIEATDTPATAAERPAEFVLTDLDNGAVLRVQPGDVIAMRLPLEDPANPLWILAREPDPAIVEITDSLLWAPSEPGAEPTHFEFVFWVIGTGATEMTFSHGPLTPTSRTVGVRIEASSG